MFDLSPYLTTIRYVSEQPEPSLLDNAISTHVSKYHVLIHMFYEVTGQNVQIKRCVFIVGNNIHILMQFHVL